MTNPKFVTKTHSAQSPQAKIDVSDSSEFNKVSTDAAEHKTFAVIDFETTGLKPQAGDRAIEIGIY